MKRSHPRKVGRPRKAPRAAQGEAATHRRGTTRGKQAIASFLAMNGERCGLTEEDVVRFLDLVDMLHFNGLDVEAVVRSAWLAGRTRVPAAKRSRVARLAFAQRTTGRRPGSSAWLPSLLWATAVAQCASLPELNRVLEEIAQGTFGVPAGGFRDAGEASLIPDRQNAAVAQFLAANPACTANAGSIQAFLDLVDSRGLNQRDILSLTRTLALEGWIGPPVGRSALRATQRQPPGQRDAFKYGFLWGLLERYCGQMPRILEFASGLLSGRPTEPPIARPSSLQTAAAVGPLRPQRRVPPSRSVRGVAPLLPAAAVEAEGDVFSRATRPPQAEPAPGLRPLLRVGAVRPAAPVQREPDIRVGPARPGRTRAIEQAPAAELPPLARLPPWESARLAIAAASGATVQDRRAVDAACWSGPRRDTPALLAVAARTLPPAERLRLAQDPDSAEAYDRTCYDVDRVLTSVGVPPILPPDYDVAESFLPLRWTWRESAASRLSGLSCAELAEQLENVEELGSGEYGTVSSATLKGDPSGYPLALKREKRIIREDDPEQIFRETQMLRITSSFVERGLSPNFNLYFGGCTVPLEQVRGRRSVEFMEAMEMANGDMYGFVRAFGRRFADLREGDRARYEESLACALFSIFVQGLMAVVALAYAGIDHGDLHFGNVFFNYIEPVWFGYRALADTWVIPTCGFLAKIGDFGGANLWSPEDRREEFPNWAEFFGQALYQYVNDATRAIVNSGLGESQMPEILWMEDAILVLRKGIFQNSAERQTTPRRLPENPTELLQLLRQVLVSTNLRGLLRTRFRPPPDARILFFDVDSLAGEGVIGGQRV